MGSSDPAAWQLTADFLQANALIENPVEVDDVYSDDFLPEE
jgi:ABC-type nitrate/sulfonate/bicarbonate transport system substrate-binding protein